MTTFTTNDPIFAALREVPGLDPVALQNFINLLNTNPYANAVMSQTAQRGDTVIELATPAELAAKGVNAGAGLYTNDRGTQDFVDRGDKFAIVLNKDWFVPNPPASAGFAVGLGPVTSLAVVVHEAQHSNNQALYDRPLRWPTPPR